VQSELTKVTIKKNPLHNDLVRIPHHKPVILLWMTAKLTFSGALLVFLNAPSALAEEGIEESPKNEIGYASVADALAALRRCPGVQISREGDWTIVSDTATSTVWSFTPPEHPAHPSAVKRSTVLRGGSTYIDMKVRCEASKTACDKLVADFQQLNKRMGESIQGQHSTAPVAAPVAPRRRAEAAAALEEINVTSDSVPGWLPSADQRVSVPQITQDFLAALDSDQYQKAYDLMADSQKALETFERFSKRVREFKAQAGAAKVRRVVKITWTKDPANAPAPGVYAAVDLASQFENIDRHCGYIVLYQRDAASPFLVVRQEDNYITNENARQIATKQSPLAVEEIWGRLSRHCPNYAAAATAGKSD
jgi:hypothetical protein